MFLSNGQVLCCTSPRKSRRSSRDLKTSQLARSPGLPHGQGQDGDEFEVTWSNDTAWVARGLIAVIAAQAAPVHLQAIVFRGGCSDFSVRESVLTDQQGNVNHFAFLT